MSEETSTGPQALLPANDNGALASREDRPENIAAAKLDRVVLDVARLIARRLAREAFEVKLAANDNRPDGRKGEGRGPDGKPLGNRREDQPP
ncbi:hypothetical protein LB523_28055 [Mesorhizobium sp. ESP-6-4]|uniref:hypothetical protein n=1 Tax=unclassified Mesorhizobium TaxID=325217 RepID=UPI001CC99A8C|nr:MULTISPECIES: hypothetical protein [unclassified Mesorhizobium]MBZ9662909.1 hypothetical protein [Mesorhizobium sp. ESP-6-4]MBZ9844078.1 hypothetical protein [Mesorhizobium sp. CA5]